MNIPKIGQIIPNRYAISRQITSLATRADIHTVVEVGTWNGLGSTRCILDGLSGKQDYLFKSYECWEEMYKEALENNKPYLNDRFQIIKGKMVNEDTLCDWFNLNELNAEQKQWLEQDMQRMSAVDNVFETVPPSIDLLILDGGEFSTYKEWLLLKNRTTYVVMDDTTTLKCRRIREEILKEGAYQILADDVYERNGYLVAKIR